MGGSGTRAVTAALVALAAAGAACGGGGGGGGEGLSPQVVVTPDDSLVPTRGGEDIPAVAVGALKECDRRLRAGENAPLAESMDRLAAMTSPVTLSVCRACGGTAKINLERFREGLADLRTAEEMRRYFPDSVRGDLLELTFRSQVVGYAALGDEAEARQALTALIRLEPDAAGAYVRECEAARPPDSRVRCEMPAPGASSPQTGEPGESPGTTSPGTEPPSVSPEPEESPDEEGPGATPEGETESPSSPDSSPEPEASPTEDGSGPGPDEDETGPGPGEETESSPAEEDPGTESPGGVGAPGSGRSRPGGN
ncbi:hypothetical protein HS048_25895 [Planomonospora sp. ID91781]|uniref:hypothetical protein n=1 Tax=Planomonospora sp. ID91781 TaxID=2738135 RepID=UPI0018C37F94|nr:hypothetical protein [Planomonospora sp. ID91781]MBG0824145.1 hypothetical protein [Planomonospora sp. ID91781]